MVLFVGGHHQTGEGATDAVEEKSTVFAFFRLGFLLNILSSNVSTTPQPVEKGRPQTLGKTSSLITPSTIGAGLGGNGRATDSEDVFRSCSRFSSSAHAFASTSFSSELCRRNSRGRAVTASVKWCSAGYNPWATAGTPGSPCTEPWPYAKDDRLVDLDVREGFVRVWRRVLWPGGLTADGNVDMVQIENAARQKPEWRY